jgi:hypothetical protein
MKNDPVDCTLFNNQLPSLYMRFTLRLLFALMFTTALIPLLATALTFFVHESPSRREIAFLPSPLSNDLHIRGLHGESLLARANGLSLHTHVYLRLREMFRFSSTGRQQREQLLQLVAEDENKDFWLDNVDAPPYWYEFPNGIRISNQQVQVRHGEQAVTFRTIWKPHGYRIAKRGNHIYFHTNDGSGHYILAVSAAENSIIATTVIDKTYRQATTEQAGRFFLITALAIAIPLYTLFLWRILRFHRQTKSPNKNSEIAPA